jgi:halimadienyl-diphosphate synthase
MAHRGRPQDIVQQARQLLASLGNGAMSIAAYDTAWVARLPEVDRLDRPAFPESLDWLCTHQHADGSWGGHYPYYHDRIISTLAALLSLTRWQGCINSSESCERGLRYIWKNAVNLPHDPYETVGFELIIPTLMEEAQRLHLRLPYGYFEKYDLIRAHKLARIPAKWFYNRQNPALYSLEFMGGNLDRELAASIQEENGSIGDSPSATVYYLMAMGEESRARRYIAEVMAGNGGGAVFSYPLEVFERAWVLYNLDLAGLLPLLREEAKPHLDYLRQVWDEREGVAFSRCYSARDLDDTAVTFKMLTRAAQLYDDPRYRVSLDFLPSYAEKDHFRTFRFETDASLSSNIHLLDALASCGDGPTARSAIEMILAFMRRTRSLKAFWFDKWHASPYYVTAHAILSAPFARELVEDAVFWTVNTQNADGSWGHFGHPSIEESAYALQCLLIYRRHNGKVPKRTLDRAATYLRARRQERNHPPFWISKTLFAPLYIIESAVISALAMYETI